MLHPVLQEPDFLQQQQGSEVGWDPRWTGSRGSVHGDILSMAGRGLQWDFIKTSGAVSSHIPTAKRRVMRTRWSHGARPQDHGLPRVPWSCHQAADELVPFVQGAWLMPAGALVGRRAVVDGH